MVDTINNTQKATPAAQTQNASEDIVSKVSKMSSITDAATQKPADKFSELEQSVNKAFVSPEELARIKDPFARQIIETKQKEMLSGMNKKFQEISEMRKSLEEQRQQLSQSKPKYDIATKEGLKQALNDPEFSSLVKEVAHESAPDEFIKQGGTQDEWSVLTESERFQFKTMRDEINQLKQSQITQNLNTIDSRLKERYVDYDPTAINTLADSINTGRMNTEQLRELMWKALNYENAIKRAADITRNELNGTLTQKMNANSFESVTNPNASIDGVMPRQDNENSGRYFSRIARARLQGLTKK